MLNHLVDFLIFFFEAATIVACILIVVAGIIAISSKGKLKAQKGELKIIPRHKAYKEQKQQLQREILAKADVKRIKKEDKAAKKAQNKRDKATAKNKKNAKQKTAITQRVFLIQFTGNMMATAVNALREEVTAILAIATKADEVVVCIESGGGVVHGYGLGASQLQRIKDHHIPLTICVDKVAASGGYMMASVADKILAAPFAILGSIGVVAQLPNFHRLLKEKGIDFEQITAGEYKRTLTVFGKNTDKGRKKMQHEIDETHQLFKQFVAKNRPKVDLKKVATGEHWFGEDAIKLGLVDQLITSDEYLCQMLEAKEAELFEISYQQKKSLGAKMLQGARQSIADFYRKNVQS